MLRILLSPAALRDAALAVRHGPYGVGLAVRRPWLRLLGVALLAALLLVGTALIVGVAAAIAGLYGVQFIDPDILSAAAPDLTLDEEIRFIAALAVTLFLMSVAVLGAAMIVYRRGLGTFLWPRPQGGWRLLGLGFVVMMAVAFIQWPIANWLEPGGVAPLFDPSETTRTRLLYALVSAVGLLAAAASEEIAFRGVLLRATATLTRRVWLLCLVNGVLFSAIHLDPDPTSFVARAMSGAVWTWATLRLGGIAFGVGAHWANNLFIVWFLEPISKAAVPGRPIPAPYLLFEVFTVLVIFVAVELLARGRPAPPQPIARPAG
jgi:membrane protease YdiL (CAAX protease family)